MAASGGDDVETVEELRGRLPKRTFVWRTAEQPSARALRTRYVTSHLRGPLTWREIARLGRTWEVATERPEGLLAEPPPLPLPPVRQGDMPGVAQ